MTLRVEATEIGARFRVRVQPRASRTEVAGPYGEAVKVRVTAPPVDGAANEAVRELLAERLGVPASSVRIAHGATGRTKVVEVDGVAPGRVRAALDG